MVSAGCAGGRLGGGVITGLCGIVFVTSILALYITRIYVNNFSGVCVFCFLRFFLLVRLIFLFSLFGFVADLSSPSSSSRSASSSLIEVREFSSSSVLLTEMGEASA